MKRLNRSKLFLSLGIESAEAAVDNDFNENDSDVAEELETEQESAEIKEDNQLLEDVSDATESAMELEVAVEAASMTKNGLSRIEAAALTVALKNSIGRYISVENNVVPAIESYEVGPVGGGEEGDNKEKTNEAKKGMKATIKAFVDAILEKLKGFVKKIMNFFKAFSDRNVRTFDKLPKIAKQIDTIPDFKDLKIRQNSNNIHLSGVFDIEKFSESMKLLANVTEVMYTHDRGEEQDKFLKAGMDALKASDEQPWDKVRIALNGHMAIFFNDMFKETSKGEGGEVRSPELPGGRRMMMVPGKDTGSKQLPSIIFQRTEKGNNEVKEEITIKSKAALADMLDDVMFFCNKGLIKFADFNRVNRSTRLQKEFKDIEKGLKIAAGEDARNSGNRDQMLSITNFFRGEVVLRWIMYDYCVLIVNNALQITTKTFAAAKALDEEKKKEDAKP